MPTMEKNYCTSLRGRTFTVGPCKVPAHWFGDCPVRIDGYLPSGTWTVDSIGECGPGGEFLIVYQTSPKFRLAYVYLNVGLALVA